VRLMSALIERIRRRADLPESFRGDCSVGVEHENMVFVFASVSPASSRWMAKRYGALTKRARPKFAQFCSDGMRLTQPSPTASQPPSPNQT
jgi:hypothetical protein